MRAPVGSINKNPFDEICIGRGLAAIRPNNLVSKDFLFYYLLMNQTDLSKKGNSGSVFDSITKEQLESIAIPLPPHEVQQKIVNEIEQYQKVIDGCNLIIQNYNPTFKINESWRLTKLGELITEIQAGLLRRNHEINREEDNIPYIKMDCLKDDGNLHFEKLAYTTATKKEIQRYILRKDDILFNVRNSPELVGKTAIYQDSYEVALYNHMLLRIRLNSNYANPVYINYAFLLESVKSQLDQIKKGVTSVSAIYQVDLENLSFPLPSLEIQNKIVEQIQSDMRAIDQCKILKTQMDNKIKEVIDSLWQTNTKKSPL
jgi:type I restriction enzyme S subunit